MFPSSILVNLLQKWGLFSSIFCDKKICTWNLFLNRCITEDPTLLLLQSFHCMCLYQVVRSSSSLISYALPVPNLAPLGDRLFCHNYQYKQTQAYYLQYLQFGKVVALCSQGEELGGFQLYCPLQCVPKERLKRALCDC